MYSKDVAFFLNGPFTLNTGICTCDCDCASDGMGTMHFYIAIHTRLWQTLMETVTDACTSADAQCAKIRYFELNCRQRT